MHPTGWHVLFGRSAVCQRNRPPSTRQLHSAGICFSLLFHPFFLFFLLFLPLFFLFCQRRPVAHANVEQVASSVRIADAPCWIKLLLLRRKLVCPPFLHRYFSLRLCLGIFHPSLPRYECSRVRHRATVMQYHVCYRPAPERPHPTPYSRSAMCTATTTTHSLSLFFVIFLYSF